MKVGRADTPTSALHPHLGIMRSAMNTSNILPRAHIHCTEKGTQVVEGIQNYDILTNFMGGKFMNY